MLLTNLMLFMKVYFLLTYFSLLIFQSSAQSTDGFYNLKGKKIETGDSLSMNMISERFYGVKPGLFSSYDYYYFNSIESKLTGISELIYEKLSGKPLYISATSKPDFLKIQQIATNFTRNYPNSFFLYNDLNNAVKDGDLNKNIVLKTLGIPSKVDSNNWYYQKLKLSLGFTDSVLRHFKSENFDGNLSFKRNLYKKSTQWKTPRINNKFELIKTISPNNIVYFCLILDDEKYISDTADNDLKIYFLFQDNSVMKIKNVNISLSDIEFYPTAIQVANFAKKRIKSIQIGTYREIVFNTEDSELFNNYAKVLAHKNP
jgi:hypothetical protein